MQTNQITLLAALMSRNFHQEKVDQAISQVSIEKHTRTVSMYDMFITEFYADPANETSIQFLVEKGFITKENGFITAKGKNQVIQDPNAMTARDLGIKTLFNIRALRSKNALTTTLAHFDQDTVEDLLLELVLIVSEKADNGYPIPQYLAEAFAGLVVMAYPQLAEPQGTVEIGVPLGALVPLEEEVVEQEVINLVKPKKSRKKAEKESV
jgi:hypothetical protein